MYSYDNFNLKWVNLDKILSLNWGRSIAREKNKI